MGARPRLSSDPRPGGDLRPVRRASGADRAEIESAPNGLAGAILVAGGVALLSL
jgi:hypothetical protein